MNPIFSFVLLVTTALFITSCSSPQPKPTSPLPSAPITDTDTHTTYSATPPPTTTIATPRVMVPTPYVPKPSTSKTTPTKKAISPAKPEQKKASKPSNTKPSKAKPSKIVKKSPPSQTKSAPTQKKLALTAPPTPKTSAAKPPEVSVSLDVLPLKIGPWTLSESQSLSNQCNLVSATNNMPDGQGKTPTYLEITQQHIIFHTKSNIDTSYTGTGVFIGQQNIIPIEQLYTPTSVLFDSNYGVLVNTMKNHDLLEIKIGFWPSWPVTQAYATTLKTGHFETAYNALKKCNGML